MVQLAGDTIVAPGVPNCQVFTANGTWTKPSGLRHIIVEVVGGGGAGGGCTSIAGGAGVGAGGGAGGYTRKLILASALSASHPVTVGAGGTIGAAGANPGNGGGTSSFDTFCQATGGGGGGGCAASATSTFTSGGGGGVGSSGDLNRAGQAGGRGRSVVTDVWEFGLGGDSAMGHGPVSPPATNGFSGSSGVLYGAGGGGGFDRANGGSKTGGAGAAGVVIVTTYF